MKKTPEDIQSSRRRRKVSDNALPTADIKERCRLFGLSGEFDAPDAFRFDTFRHAVSGLYGYWNTRERWRKTHDLRHNGEKNSARESWLVK